MKASQTAKDTTPSVVVTPRTSSHRRMLEHMSSANAAQQLHIAGKTAC